MGDALGLSGWDGTGVLVVEGATIFTSPLAEPIPNGVVVVTGGLVEAVGTAGEVFVPQSARRVSGAGGSVLAGFWDVHVRLDPGFLAAAADPATPASDLESWLAENFTAFGFTGLVDTGTPLSEVQPLLDRIQREQIRGPAILATGGAALAGLEVAGADAGVWTEEWAAGLLATETTVVPALALILPDGGASDAELDAALLRLDASREGLTAFAGLGGRVAFGSGFGWGASQDPIVELELMQDAGLAFDQLLAALTTEPAARFGYDDRGQVEPGMVADLVLVDGDPRTDISSLERVRWVLRGGVPVRGEVR
jgi:imidazolonepropionase-like amidohydrolase